MMYPTEAHKDYLQYAASFAKEKDFSLMIKGSIANSTATAYSDIDVLLMCSDEGCVDEFVYGYRPIVMSNKTQRPKGILIVVYDNGICVDIDVRKRVTREELQTAIVLHDGKEKNMYSAIIEREEDLTLNTVPDREEWYQLLRLFHRSLIKYLSGKAEAGRALLEEIREALQEHSTLPWTGNYKADIQLGLNEMSSRYLVPQEIKNALQELIDQL